MLIQIVKCILFATPKIHKINMGRLKLEPVWEPSIFISTYVRPLKFNLFFAEPAKISPIHMGLTDIPPNLFEIHKIFSPNLSGLIYVDLLKFKQMYIRPRFHLLYTICWAY